MNYHMPFRLYLLLTGMLLCFGASTLRAQNVSKLEYFIDVDPGFGSGINVTVTPDTVVATSFQFNVTALTQGFHNLYFRSFVNPYQVIADGKTITKGGWSLSSVRTFYKEVLVAQNGALPNVTAGEFYVDEDPGFGKATNIPVTAGTDITNAGFTFEVTGLAVGFHNLYVRFKDVGGKWSSSHVRNFYKEEVVIGNGATSNITAGEFFMDADPGFGKGNAISVAPGATASTNFTIDITSLTAGFHNLHMRFKDATGKWSLASIRNFYKEQILSGNTTVANITKGEYFIDSDPGYGQGINIPFSAFW